MTTLKKKALIDWLNQPITNLYYKKLLKNKEDLERQLLFVSRSVFCDGMKTQRSEVELNIQTTLLALDHVLADLDPIMKFRKYCAQNNLDLAEVPEKYECLELGESTPTQYSNPLDIFINTLE